MSAYYMVYHGRYSGETAFLNWGEAARFIKHCLDSGEVVRGVAKVQHDKAKAKGKA